MQYKYYILKQKAGPSGSDKYDLANSYDLVKEVFPTGTWGLKYTPNSEWTRIWRWAFNGALTFGGADYTAIMGALDDCSQMAIRIQVLCSGSYSTLWEGFFSKYEFEVDLDRCLLTFKPETCDKYTRILNILDTKVNFLDTPTDYQLFVNVYGYPIEYYITPGQYTNGFPVGWVPPSWHELPALPGSQYYLYQMEIKPQNLYNALGQLLYTYHTARIYAREWVLTDDGITPPDPSWTYDSEVSVNVFKWVRPVGNSAFTTYTQTITGDIENWTLQGYSTAIGSTYYIQHARRLNEVLEFLLSKVGLGFSSLLFSNPNPMGGHALNNLMLVSTGEMVHRSDATTIQMVSLQDLLRWLREYFNCQWYIDDARTLHIENEKYFFYGMSYTAPKSVNLDLTAGIYEPYTRHMNRYSYATPPRYLYEEWQVPFSNGRDFVGEKISYPCSADSQTKFHVTQLASDIWWMYVHASELPRDGFILLQAHVVALGVYEVQTETGLLTGGLLSNGHLSLANLHERYWKWERIFPRGTMNGQDMTFSSSEYRKIQVPISVPACCSGLDLDGLIRTGIGDGQLEEAEYDGKSGMIKIVVKHE